MGWRGEGGRGADHETYGSSEVQPAPYHKNLNSREKQFQFAIPTGCNPRDQRETLLRRVRTLMIRESPSALDVLLKVQIEKRLMIAKKVN